MSFILIHKKNTIISLFFVLYGLQYRYYYDYVHYDR